MTEKTAKVGRKGRPSAEDVRQKMATVLDVAKQQFAKHGYRAVTMRGVAEQACVSTRTLYNWYADKLALFEACLNDNLERSLVPQIDTSRPPAEALRAYAAELVQFLSRDTSLGLGLVIYREGAEFPEIAAAAFANQNTWLVEPLAAFLREHGLEEARSEAQTKLFIAMALSEFLQRFAFGLLPLSKREIEEHACRVTRLFLNGAGRGTGRN